MHRAKLLIRKFLSWTLEEGCYIFKNIFLRGNFFRCWTYNKKFTFIAAHTNNGILNRVSCVWEAFVEEEKDTSLMNFTFESGKEIMVCGWMYLMLPFGKFGLKHIHGLLSRKMDRTSVFLELWSLITASWMQKYNKYTGSYLP